VFALRSLHRFVAIFFLGLCASLPVAIALGNRNNSSSAQERSHEPWASEEILRPADFAHQLNSQHRATSPTVLYVGFRTLFEGAHIPGALFHGTASNEKGLEELKKWLEPLPRDTQLVIYCGCCPFDHCPNIRPAYNSLRELGFTHARVLLLPTSFAADWVEKGYPIEKGRP
jgi:hypothetical protein